MPSHRREGFLHVSGAKGIHETQKQWLCMAYSGWCKLALPPLHTPLDEEGIDSSRIDELKN